MSHSALNVQQTFSTQNTIHKLKCVFTHTHTRTLTYMLRASSAVLLNVYSMYIVHCCSVGLFGAKFHLFIIFFKYIKQLFYFDEFVCLLSDLTIVVIFIFAGQ